MTRALASRRASRTRAIARAQRMPSTATPGPPEARARLHTQHGVPSHTNRHRPSRNRLPRGASPFAAV
eukprot:4704808-Lingulodinium_polyedra.AAC.1